MLKRFLCWIGIHNFVKKGEPYLWEGSSLILGSVPSFNTEVNITETRQQRECKDCGLIQERDIRA